MCVVKYYWHDCLVKLPCKGIWYVKQKGEFIERVFIPYLSKYVWTWPGLCWTNWLRTLGKEAGATKPLWLAYCGLKYRSVYNSYQMNCFLLKTLQRWRSQPFPEYLLVEFWMWTMLLDFCSIQGIPEVQTNMIYVVSPCSVSDQDKVKSNM